MRSLGSVAGAAAVLLLSAVAVTAQSPVPATNAPRGAAANVWTLAHDVVGHSRLREFDGSTGAPVSTKGIDVPGCTWRSVLPRATDGVWVVGAPVYTLGGAVGASFRLGSLCFAWVAFAGGPPMVSRLWVQDGAYARTVRATQDGGSLWALIDPDQPRVGRALWRVDPGGPPARILDGIRDGVAAGGWLWVVFGDRPYRFDTATGDLERLRLGCGRSGCGIERLRVDAGTAGVVFQGRNDWGPGIRGQVLDLVRLGVQRLRRRRAGGHPADRLALGGHRHERLGRPSRRPRRRPARRRGPRHLPAQGGGPVR